MFNSMKLNVADLKQSNHDLQQTIATTHLFHDSPYASVIGLFIKKGTTHTFALLLQPQIIYRK